jgi:hypothetical protein
VRTILREIRAVAGVTGVAVLVKRDGRTEHLFPAAFTERHTGELLKMVTAAYQRLRGFSRLNLRFDRVTVHLLNQPEFLLFATALPDVDESLFETVVSSKLSAIARVVSASDPATRPGGAARSASAGAGFNLMVIDVLMDGCNSVTRRLAGTTGLNRLATSWRAARDEVQARNPALAAVEVDAAGHLSLRKGQTVPPTASTVESFAFMIERFMDGIGTLRPEAEDAFYSVAERHHDLLEKHGFFHYAKTASGYAQSRVPQAKPTAR